MRSAGLSPEPPIAADSEAVMMIRKTLRVFAAAAAMVIVAPAIALACPICFGGDPNSPEARGLNWAVFTLLGVTGGVLSGFVGFIFHLMKRSRQAMSNEGALGTGRPGEPGGRT